MGNARPSITGKSEVALTSAASMSQSPSGTRPHPIALHPPRPHAALCVNTGVDGCAVGRILGYRSGDAFSLLLGISAGSISLAAMTECFPSKAGA